LVDHFSRFAYILTSANQTTNEFRKLIGKVLEEGQIKTLLTDQYGGLSSKEFSHFLKEKGVDRIFTAVDHASSNGLNERLNQTITGRIRCRVKEKGNKVGWATIAHRCVNEYNDTVHSVTQFPPSYLMKGKEISILPEELRLMRDYLKDKALAIENSKRDHDRNKARVDKNKVTYDFQMVWRHFSDSTFPT